MTAPEQFKPHHHGCKQIVEIVRDPASQLAHRFHFLRLVERLTGRLEFGLPCLVVGDITSDSIKDAVFRGAYPRQPYLPTVLLAILVLVLSNKMAVDPRPVGFGDACDKFLGMYQFAKLPWGRSQRHGSGGETPKERSRSRL